MKASWNCFNCMHSWISNGNYEHLWREKRNLFENHTDKSVACMYLYALVEILTENIMKVILIFHIMNRIEWGLEHFHILVHINHISLSICLLFCSIATKTNTNKIIIRMYNIDYFFSRLVMEFMIKLCSIANTTANAFLSKWTFTFNKSKKSTDLDAFNCSWFDELKCGTNRCCLHDDIL